MSDIPLFPVDHGPWVSAQGTAVDGFPILLRFRDISPSLEDRERFRFLILAHWPYEVDNTSGLPCPDLMDSMEEFEDCFFQASDTAASWGTCVAVKTHNGVREWRFYTPDIDTLQAEFSQALNGLGPYPFEFEVYEDPEWTGLAEFRDNAE